MALSKICGPIYIKPDLSPEERAKESILLKERWGLIQKGAERKQIKLRNGALFVDNQLMVVSRVLSLLEQSTTLHSNQPLLLLKTD